MSYGKLILLRTEASLLDFLLRALFNVSLSKEFDEQVERLADVVYGQADNRAILEQEINRFLEAVKLRGMELT